MYISGPEKYLDMGLIQQCCVSSDGMLIKVSIISVGKQSLCLVLFVFTSHTCDTSLIIRETPGNEP